MRKHNSLTHTAVASKSSSHLMACTGSALCLHAPSRYGDDAKGRNECQHQGATQFTNIHEDGIFGFSNVKTEYVSTCQPGCRASVRRPSNLAKLRWRSKLDSLRPLVDKNTWILTFSSSKVTYLLEVLTSHTLFTVNGGIWSFWMSCKPASLRKGTKLARNELICCEEIPEDRLI